MFNLFFSLYNAMLTGSWVNYTAYDFQNANGTIRLALIRIFNSLSTLLTSVFGDGTYTTFGDDVFTANNTDWIKLVAFILALITSIGIVVLAVKGIKKVFGVFFMGIR